MGQDLLHKDRLGSHCTKQEAQEGQQEQNNEPTK